MNRVDELVNLIVTNAQAYYSGQDCISDEEFDSLVSELRNIDPDNPILYKTGWGYSTQKTEKVKIKHRYGFSIGISDKIKPEEFNKFIKNRDIDYLDFYASLKLDGASLFCYYTKGNLDMVLTRGDGEYGLDVTQYIKYLIPNHLNCEFTGYVRGEFILPEKIWSNKYIDQGKSSRNFSAGKLNGIDTDITIIKDHKVVCYEAFLESGPISNSAQLNFLETEGFNVVPHIHLSSGYSLTTEEEAFNLLQMLNTTTDGTNKENLYQCDGLVYTWWNSKFAVKWNTNKVETEVLDIVWQNSRLGKLTPVLIVKPVNISGATINRVSGYNYENIKNNKIGKGSKIIITRSGEVIPKLEEVITEGENSIPIECPYCGSKLRQDGVNLICDNKNCSGRGNLGILYFINTVIPVDGLGDKFIEKFLHYFKISSIQNLIQFAKTNRNFELIQFCNKTSGLGNSVYTKLQELIQKINSELPLDKFLIALGLPQLNEKTIHKILNLYDFNTLIEKLNNNEIQSIDGINYIAIESLYMYKDYILSLYYALTKRPFYTLKKSNRYNIIKSEEKICITGPLSVSRKAFVDECNEYGIEEVSIAKATILVTNSTNQTTKMIEAKKRGTKIMSEAEFREKFLIGK